MHTFSLSHRIFTLKIIYNFSTSEYSEPSGDIIQKIEVIEKVEPPPDEEAPSAPRIRLIGTPKSRVLYFKPIAEKPVDQLYTSSYLKQENFSGTDPVELDPAPIAECKDAVFL